MHDLLHVCGALRVKTAIFYFFFFLPWEVTTQGETLFPCIAVGIWEQSMSLPLTCSECMAIVMEGLPSCVCHFYQELLFDSLGTGEML